MNICLGATCWLMDENIHKFSNCPEIISAIVEGALALDIAIDDPTRFGLRSLEQQFIGHGGS